LILHYHSYGAAIALQWALDAPGEVLSLMLLEPCLIEGKEFWDLIAYLKDLYERGESEKTLDLFFSGLMGPDYPQTLNAVLPHDACKQALADVDTFFQVELPELKRWSFTAEDARHISQPVLAVTGSESSPIHRGWHNRLRQLVPHAEELIVPNATHALPIMNPRALAEGMAHFLAEHPM
jgi:3-oxoadipate enol-lactonase